uniref:Uncharacterized protein n=1 Tax=Arundo donax TaxID=35708 RepID=A0A0A9BM68_ARUDO
MLFILKLMDSRRQPTKL